MDQSHKYTSAWVATSFFGSAVCAFILSCLFLSDPAASFFMFFFSLIIFFFFSLFASIPVLIYSLLIRKRTAASAIWKRMRNFQIVLYILFLIGFAWYNYNPYTWLDREYFSMAGITTIYLVTGFIVWRRKILRDQPAYDTTVIDGPY